MDITKHRINAGLTQQQLAQLSGLSIEQIIAIETKEILAKDMGENDAIRLAYALGISVDDMLGAVVLNTGALVYIDEFEWFSPKKEK